MPDIRLMTGNFDRSTQDERMRAALAPEFEPSTAQVIGSFFTEARTGPGTFGASQDADAVRMSIRRRQGSYDPLATSEGDAMLRRINKEKTAAEAEAAQEIFESLGADLSQEQWQTSKHFREDVEYFDGMTEAAAEVLARRSDERRRRDEILKNASGGQVATGFVLGGIPGAFLDPYNILLAAVPVPGLATVRGTSTLARLGMRARIGAAEGAAGSLALEPAAFAQSRLLQEDYTMTTALQNLTFGVAVGVGLHTGGGAIADRFTIRDHQSSQQTAIAQLLNGRGVDVEPVVVAKEIKALRKEIEAAEGTPINTGTRRNIGNADPILSDIQPVSNQGLEVINESPKDGYTTYAIKNDKGENIGSISTRRSKSGYETISNTGIDDLSEMGKGHAIRAYSQLADKTLSEGNTLRSDGDVSPDAVRLYEALERRGYIVEKNPNAVQESDGSLSARTYVFEVTGKTDRKKRLADLEQQQSETARRSIEGIEDISDIDPAEARATDDLVQKSPITREDSQIETEIIDLEAELKAANEGGLPEALTNDLKALEEDFGGITKAVEAATTCMTKG